MSKKEIIERLKKQNNAAEKDGWNSREFKRGYARATRIAIQLIRKLKDD